MPILWILTISGDGTVNRTPDKDEYSIGESVELEAIPQQGWEFSHWSGALSGDSNPVIFMGDADLIVNAHFLSTNMHIFLPLVIR
jgi:hypothetical protein